MADGRRQSRVMEGAPPANGRRGLQSYCQGKISQEAGPTHHKHEANWEIPVRVDPRMNPWVPFYGVLVLLFVGRPVWQVVIHFNALRRMRLTVPKDETIDRAQTPPSVAAILGSEEEELNAMGFHFERAVRRTLTEGESSKTPVWIYVNSETGDRVTVRRWKLTEGAIPRYDFETLLEHGRIILSGADAEEDASTENRLQKKIGEMPLRDQYKAHLAFVELHGQGRCTVLAEPGEMDAELARIWQESMLERAARGDVIQAGEGVYAYPAGAAFRYAIRAYKMGRNVRAHKETKATLKRLSGIPATVPGAGEEIDEFTQLARASENRRLGGPAKLLLLIGSLALFVIAFHMSLSWRTVFILLGVLSFHEGGHLLGMRVFGYKGLQMLYLPFLGAVAIGGKREYVKPWQELVVLFMGPLPGLYIGLFMISHPVLMALPARRQIVLMLILLNLFNLLPIHPLDGGQIWDILLFRRFPFGRVAFLGLGAVAIIVAGVEHYFGSAFIVFGTLLLLQIPRQVQQAKLITALKTEFAPPLSRQTEATLLPAIFALIEKMSFNLKPPVKIALVRGVLAQCKSDPAGPVTALLGLVCYTSPIWITLMIGMANRAHHHAPPPAAAIEQIEAENVSEVIQYRTLDGNLWE
jgi:Zn-dependent protease